MLIGFKNRGWSAYFTIGLMMIASSRPLVQAGTEVYLDITADQTWTEAGSPYQIIVDNIAIKNGATVTIQPGVEVLLNQNVNVLITGNARLRANGTVEKPIRYGGKSRDLPGGVLTITTSQTCEFSYCHFANMSLIGIAYVAPFGNHLFQHCVFRAFTGNVFSLDACPARILNNIFRDNSAYGIFMNHGANFNDENTPQIWYNVFDKNGLNWEMNRYATVDAQSRPFFKYNRINGGVGMRLRPYNGSILNLLVTDCDLSRCVSSIICETAWGGGTSLEAHRCDLYATSAGNLTNNYWGTTDITTIYSRIGVAASSQIATPWATASFFPQADIDNSDNGNSTAQNDADMVKKSLVGLVTLTPTQRQIADVDNNGTVDIRDAMIIESFVNGMIWKLPAK